MVFVPYSAITSNMATNIFAEILQWSASQPLWQRDALRRLFTVGTLTSTDLDALTEICKSVHGLAPSSKKALPLSAQHLPVGGPAAATAVFLVDLTHHIGVNALAPEQTVSFGPNLTIVYGETATGKSGHTRILKRACRSRFVEDVLGNVLGTSAPLKARVTIRINEGGTETPISWSPDTAPSPGLAQISVFDRHWVPVYLRDKTDVAFRPFGLDLFDKLASACAEVKKRLDAEAAFGDIVAASIARRHVRYQGSPNARFTHSIDEGTARPRARDPLRCGGTTVQAPH